MRIHTLYLAPLAVFALQACATAPPPPELLTARDAYARAQNGAPATLDPSQLHDAKTALDRAELSYNQEGVAPETIDLAVVANLKTATAEAVAVIVQAGRDKARAVADLAELQKAQLANARSDTKSAQAQTVAANVQAQVANADATQTHVALDAEHQRRLDAENRLRTALGTLAQIASVKDSDRGMVVSFQGDALFKTAEWTLRPEAMAKLAQIADSLRQQERKIVVEGNTDNQGGVTPYNQDLSEKRAAAVRDFLISKGMPQDLISSVGYGATRPVAENTTIEGRAANRRVDIIISPSKSQ